MKEELNIQIKILRKLNHNIHDYGDFKINLIPFVVEYLSGKVILKEHANYQLLELKQLQKLDWAEADIPVLNELLNNQL